MAVMEAVPGSKKTTYTVARPPPNFEAVINVLAGSLKNNRKIRDQRELRGIVSNIDRELKNIGACFSLLKFLENAGALYKVEGGFQLNHAALLDLAQRVIKNYRPSGALQKLLQTPQAKESITMLTSSSTSSSAPQNANAPIPQHPPATDQAAQKEAPADELPATNAATATPSKASTEAEVPKLPRWVMFQTPAEAAVWNILVKEGKAGTFTLPATAKYFHDMYGTKDGPSVETLFEALGRFVANGILIHKGPRDADLDGFELVQPLEDFAVIPLETAEREKRSLKAAYLRVIERAMAEGDAIFARDPSRRRIAFRDWIKENFADSVNADSVVAKVAGFQTAIHHQGYGVIARPPSHPELWLMCHPDFPAFTFTVYDADWAPQIAPENFGLKELSDAGLEDRKKELKAQKLRIEAELKAIEVETRTRAEAELERLKREKEELDQASREKAEAIEQLQAKLAADTAEKPKKR